MRRRIAITPQSVLSVGFQIPPTPGHGDGVDDGPLGGSNARILCIIDRAVDIGVIGGILGRVFFRLAEVLEGRLVAVHWIFVLGGEPAEVLVETGLDPHRVVWDGRGVAGHGCSSENESEKGKHASHDCLHE